MRHNKVACILVVLLLGAFVGCAREQGIAASPDPRVVHHPELVVLNAKVVTVDDQSSVQEAVAMRDGKFLAVGTTEDIRKLAGPTTRVVDAEGRTVLPGLVDTHLHLLQGALHWKHEVRVDMAKSLDDIYNAIKARAAQTEPGTWILIRGGWHFSQIKDRRMPTREELDAVAPNHPVHLQAAYDVVQLNSLAIKTANLAGRKIPQGVEIERDANGNPTGVLRGFMSMLWALTAYLPQLTFEEKIEQMQVMMRDFNAAGLTGIIEGAAIYDDMDYQAMFEMWRRGKMTLRVGMQVDSVDAKRALNWVPHIPQGLGDDMFWVNSLGEVVMGDVWDSAPGVIPLPPDVRADFKRVIEAAVANNVSVQIDQVTEAGIDSTLDIYEEVHAKTPIDKLRFTLIHAEQITPKQIERMKKLGMGVMIQGGRQLINSDEMREEWGPRMDDEPIIRTVYDSGLPFSGGTDGTVESTYMPFPSLYWYVSGRNLRGDVVRKTQRLNREEALRVYSRNAAWFSFQEKRRGPIAPGYLADMIIIDKDYMTVPEEEIPSIRSVMTIVGGKVVYEAQAAGAATSNAQP